MNDFGRMGRGMEGRRTVMNAASRPESGGARRRRRARAAWGRPSEQDLMGESLTTLEEVRPQTRGDCREGIRPCPFLSCQFHALHALVVPVDGGRPRLDLALVAQLDETNSCHLDVEEGLVAPFDS